MKYIIGLNMVLSIVLMLKYGINYIGYPMFFAILFMMNRDRCGNIYFSWSMYSLFYMIGAISYFELGLNQYSLGFFVIPMVIDFLYQGFEQAREEDEYIWRMNGGPSSLNRIKLVKDGDKKRFVTWVGGANGYYEGNGCKYDKYLRKIKVQGE